MVKSILEAWIRGRLVFVLYASLFCAASASVSSREQVLELTIATAHPTTVPWVYMIRDFLIPEFNTRLSRQLPNLAVEWTQAYGTLYKWHNSLDVVEIGLADIGWVGAVWESSKLPLQNITYALPFITDDLPTLLRVINRLHDEIPELRRTWERYNTHFLGVSGVDTYHLMTKFPVNSLDDLRGRKILAPGSSAIWLKGTGAIAVDGALSTYYTQLKTGVADGTLSILTGVYPFRIHELTPYITFVGIGAQCVGGLTVNLDVWRRLPQEAREILTALGGEYTERAAAEVMRKYDEAYEGLLSDGAVFSILPLAEKQRWMDGLPDLGREWVSRNEAKGLPAGAVLRGLMDGLRAAGVVPDKQWDRTIDR